MIPFAIYIINNSRYIFSTFTLTFYFWKEDKYRTTTYMKILHTWQKYKKSKEQKDKWTTWASIDYVTFLVYWNFKLWLKTNFKLKTNLKTFKPFYWVFMEQKQIKKKREKNSNNNC